jgi:hypothetical protein
MQDLRLVVIACITMGATSVAAKEFTCQFPDGIVRIDFERHKLVVTNQGVDITASQNPVRWENGVVTYGTPYSNRVYKPGTPRARAGIGFDRWDPDEGHWVSFPLACE